MRTGQFHSAQCAWHLDQYPHECECGVTRPATMLWAQAEVSAAEEMVRRAQECLRVAQDRVKRMGAGDA